MSHFELRNLKAFSVEPLLIYPTHYTGEPGYISDTETSTIWDDDAVATDWDRQQAQKTAQQGRIRPVAQNSVTGDSPPPAARTSRDELWDRLRQRAPRVPPTRKTLELQTDTHKHILIPDQSRVYSVAWLRDAEQRKTRRLWDEGQHVFDKNFIYSPSVGRWRQVQPSKPPFARCSKGLVTGPSFLYSCEDICYLKRSVVILQK